MPPASKIALHLHRLTDELPCLRALFAWIDDESPRPNSSCLFRREFELVELPESYEIIVTADSRYKLWLNGSLIGRGPLKGTTQHYRAETYDLAPLLKKGGNVLAVEVRWFGWQGPVSEVHSEIAGLFVQGLNDETLDTPGHWLVTRNASYSPNSSAPEHRAFQFLGWMDKIDTAKHQADWKELDFDATSWTPVVGIGFPPTPDQWGVESSHNLVPREVPMLSEKQCDFARCIVNRERIHFPVRIEESEGGEIWLDVGRLTTSYPMLEFEGGKDREIRVVYAEALGEWVDDPQLGRVWQKGQPRDDFTRLEPDGYYDVLTLSGDSYLFEPFHWRAFWFIKIEIGPGQEAVTLKSASHRFVSFPQKFNARFESSIPESDRLLETSIRTLQLCAHETYEDCPYYEQLNYVADTRLQIISSYYLANQTELGKRCIRLFRDSICSKGLTASREPSRRRQEIPAFSLHWVLMVHDYWMWVGEPGRDFVKTCLPGIHSVLSYFRERINDKGFVGGVKSWSWIDWVDDWDNGISPAAHAGTGSSYLTALFALAAHTVVDLHEKLGDPQEARLWQRTSETLRQTIRDRAWSQEDGYFSEGPHHQSHEHTQHTQAFAILCGATTPEQNALLKDRILDDPELHKMSMFQRFYLSRAMQEIGIYHRLFPEVLAPWYRMLENGFSTWPEKEVDPRSDCHAWNSWIAIDLFDSVLGARPAKPGWKEIELQPQYSISNYASGSFETPVGEISVSWSRDEAGTLAFEAKVPFGICTHLKLPDGDFQICENGGTISFSWGANDMAFA
ncbi:alpha-L-rhamnosidase C-terminal domain-containing protein [Pelagicoccus sp. SDUM812002]|uniref:alpha-L-rhamnosidase-related protein n=1 Tax=Pelagicoccus sp. SDUM812002 TaxID=3041266 RepID=UPI00280F7EA8|nr:alpha-L-rhamnosidase C-terminal domain-containing protein [Pelagicoccus sp. SDUM812002]MDQ8186551.1 alpha-L-rhamnosidase C-terminal domain-containing protein [Pelagicoccus sp. SDUM812002]